MGYIRYTVSLRDPRFGKLFPRPECGELIREERQRRFFDAKRARIAQYDATQAQQKFENFDTLTTSRLVREAYLAALRFAAEPQGWLVLHGNPGTGKSHLASAIANRRSDWLVLGLVMPDLLELLKSGFDNGDYHEILELCRTVDLLIIDDMGTESSTPWAYEKLFQIINHRYNTMRPSVFVFNGALEDLEPRIASRMQDRTLSKVYPMWSDDYRPRKDRR